MREAANDIRRGNSSIGQKLQYLSHKFISGPEISAQEAVYCCLGLALSESSNLADSHEGLCLADFAANCEFSKSRERRK